MSAPSGSIDVYPAARGPLADGPGIVFGWRITSLFGFRTDPITGQKGTGHGGEDQSYAGCAGAEIIAPIGGLLSQGWDNSGGGNWSGITGHNQDYWGFGHASKFVWPDGGTRWVEAGMVIAYTGSTGKSTGAHNHIAFRLAGTSGYSDPHDILVAAAAGGANHEGDWLDMATEAEVEEIVRKVVQEEILNQDARIKAVLQADGEKTRVYLHGDHETTRTYLADKIKQTADAVMETIRTS